MTIHKLIGYEWILNDKGISEAKEIWETDETDTLCKN